MPPIDHDNLYEIWGEDQLPHHFYKHDADEQALRALEEQQEEAEFEARRERDADSGEFGKGQPAAAAAPAPEPRLQTRRVSLPKHGHLRPPRLWTLDQRRAPRAVFNLLPGGGRGVLYVLRHQRHTCTRSVRQSFS